MIRTLAPALVLAGLTGCPAPAAPPPPHGEPPPTTQAPPADPALTADGTHFAAHRVYQGDCAPAGTRGGCHSYTFEPDGSYRELLYDAFVSGTYVVEGDAVVLTPGGAAPPARLALSPDRATVGDGFKLQP